MGRMEIRGFAYQDIVSILMVNGYDVSVKVCATTNNCSDSVYIIEYKEHDFECDVPF